jgi:hypothetical protein
MALWHSDTHNKANYADWMRKRETLQVYSDEPKHAGGPERGFRDRN